MKFEELIASIEKEITIDENQINDVRECIKLKEEQINKLKNISIPKPWILINGDKDDKEKVGIYNEVAEIIDGIVQLGYTLDSYEFEGYIKINPKDKNIKRQISDGVKRILNENRDIVDRLIEERLKIGAEELCFKKIFEVLDNEKEL